MVKKVTLADLQKNSFVGVKYYYIDDKKNKRISTMGVRFNLPYVVLLNEINRKIKGVSKYPYAQTGRHVSNPKLTLKDIKNLTDAYYTTFIQNPMFDKCIVEVYEDWFDGKPPVKTFIYTK